MPIGRLSKTGMNGRTRYGLSSAIDDLAPVVEPLESFGGPVGIFNVLDLVGVAVVRDQDFLKIIWRFAGDHIE